jgi:hypothetical protein
MGRFIRGVIQSRAARFLSVQHTKTGKIYLQDDYKMYQIAKNIHLLAVK